MPLSCVHACTYTSRSTSAADVCSLRFSPAAGLEDGGEDDGGLEGDSDNDSGPDEDGGSGPSGGRRLHAGISAIAAAVVAEGHSRDAEEQEREAEAILQVRGRT